MKNMLEIHFLRITWGDIILLKQGEEAAMIDTGFAEYYDAIKEYLDKLGIKKLSFILLSHFHNDHYGSIPNLVKNFEVEKVYLKEYSGLDKTGSSGTLAGDDYRSAEMNQWQEIKKTIEEYSSYVRVEDLDEITFGGHTLNLFRTANTIREIYEDKTYEETYHQILFSENVNSLAAFMKVNGVNIFFGGDLYDVEYNHPRASYANYQIADAIGEQIDIYKVPHHGTGGSNSPMALDIYKPKYAVITNGEEYLKASPIYQDLRRVNEDVEILLAEKKNIVFQISEEGKISWEMC